MYAVFKTGGKQYRAKAGERMRIERIDGEEGDKVEFSEVLLVGDGDGVKVGTPLVDGGRVEATVLSQGRTRKVDVVKFKRRKNYLRMGSHRQHFTEIEITGISA